MFFGVIRVPEVKNVSFNEVPVWAKVAMLLPVLFVLFFYFTYAHDAWFFQDDFGLIAQYAGAIHFEQLFDYSNFGRFLSRNAYWFFGSTLFSSNAQYFYVLNFSTIALTSFLLFKLLSRRYGEFAGLVGALIYFCLPATLESYSWLSNSQHLLAHFFAVLFVTLYMREVSDECAGPSARSTVLLGLVLLAGLSSNVLMGMVLTLPAWMLVTHPAVRRNPCNTLIVVAGGVLFAAQIITLGRYQTGAYSTAYNLDVLGTNLAFYFGSAWLGLLWLAAVAAGAVLAWRARKLFEAWLLLASIAFFLPFAFLEHQRYGQYGVLTYLCFVIGYWTLFCQFARPRVPAFVVPAGVLLLLYVFVCALEPTIRYASDNPRGRDQRELVEQLRLFDEGQGKAMKNYCFRSDRPVLNSTGVAAWDIPAEWWFVSFGTAFSVFVDPLKTYQLAKPELSCDATFVLNGSRLERVAE